MSAFSLGGLSPDPIVGALSDRARAEEPSAGAVRGGRSKVKHYSTRPLTRRATTTPQVIP